MKKLHLKYASSLLLASALFTSPVTVRAASRPLKALLTAFIFYAGSSSNEFTKNSGFTSIEGIDHSFTSQVADEHAMLGNPDIQQAVHEKMQPPSGLSKEDSARKLAEIYDIEGLFKADTSPHNGIFGVHGLYGEPRRLQMSTTEDSPPPKKKSSEFFLRGFGGGSRVKNILGFTVLMIECCILYTLIKGVLVWVGKEGHWGDNCQNCCNYYFVCNKVYNDCCRKISCGKYEGCDTFWDVPTCGLCTPCCVYFWICCNLCPESETCKKALGCERCYNTKMSDKVLSKINMQNLIKEDIERKLKETEQTINETDKAIKETEEKVKKEENKQIKEAKKGGKETDKAIKKKPKSLSELNELTDYKKTLRKSEEDLRAILVWVNNLKGEEGKEKLHPRLEALLIKSSKKAQIELQELAFERLKKEKNGPQDFNQDNISPNQIELQIKGSDKTQAVKTQAVITGSMTVYGTKIIINNP